MNTTREKPVITFGAGPSKIPREIKQDIINGINELDGSGLSILEVGHRSQEFTHLIDRCSQKIRCLYNVPENYHILFLQGGANGQFDAIPMNLFGNRGRNRADYLVTGSWSAKAAKEASKYGQIRDVCPRVPAYEAIPDRKTWSFDPEAAYLYYCDNETINGLEFFEIPQPPEDVPLVCDMCSNFLSRPVDVSRFGVIFAGAQKNMGCAGLTVVILRNDLVGRELPITPTVFNYRLQVASKSVLNTPPTFTAFVIDVMLRWVENQGGLEKMDKACKEKSQMVYRLIDNSDGFYRCPSHPENRSRVNVILRLADPKLEKLWLLEAKNVGLIGLNGHQTVGGLRASLYNAINLDDVTRLIDFMQQFMMTHKLLTSAGKSDE
ncbi:Phosphoserine aminotransferase [Fasciolopsis buskii]|uniref:Phosphoserine aminotransferase n=1 Tax=Fasciolopsis buskii TaxID=27845 RepID=A0A8E0RPN3_9TREM|nr:Phosphoserine aminotransferase [Fasciolopsis buski]